MGEHLASLEKPIMTAVEGAAAGAGFSLALLSDVVVAQADSRFLTAYTTVGLTPDCGQSWLLPRAVGYLRALDLTLRPRKLNGQEALDLGIVAELADDARATAATIAAGLSSGPAEALGAARLLVRPEPAAFAAHLDAEAATIARMAATDEAGARIDAFLQPR